MNTSARGKRPRSTAPTASHEQARRDSAGIRVGIGGWTYAPWRKTFYPPGLVQRRELAHASRQVSAIEINGTYYGTQKPATYARWRDEAPDDFLFSAKAPMRIMATRDLAKAGPQVEDFVGGIAELGDKLGPLVWQFDKGPRIERDAFAAFLELLPKATGGRPVRHVLDVRDPAFVDAAYLALLRRHGFASVFTDSPDHPSFADLTTDFVYARLMRSRAAIANGYEAAEIGKWAQRARAWASGSEPDDLPRIVPVERKAGPRKPSDGRLEGGALAEDAEIPRREVLVFFINAAKERNPAAAMALLDRLSR